MISPFKKIRTYFKLRIPILKIDSFILLEQNPRES